MGGACGTYGKVERSGCRVLVGKSKRRGLDLKIILVEVIPLCLKYTNINTNL